MVIWNGNFSESTINLGSNTSAGSLETCPDLAYCIPNNSVKAAHPPFAGWLPTTATLTTTKKRPVLSHLAAIPFIDGGLSYSCSTRCTWMCW